jgi:hypothetical protein
MLPISTGQLWKWKRTAQSPRAAWRLLEGRNKPQLRGPACVAAVSFPQLDLAEIFGFFKSVRDPLKESISGSAMSYRHPVSIYFRRGSIHRFDVTGKISFSDAHGEPQLIDANNAERFAPEPNLLPDY